LVVGVGVVMFPTWMEWKLLRSLWDNRFWAKVTVGVLVGAGVTFPVVVGAGVTFLVLVCVGNGLPPMG
jgi:hypothetical protein